MIEMGELIETSQNFEQWETINLTQAARLRRVKQVGQALRQKLVGGNARRADWRYEVENLGIDENPLHNVWRGLGTWRTLIPRKASDTFAKVFLAQGASLWSLATYQIGGHDPNVEPLSPLTF